MRIISNEFKQKAKRDINPYLAYADITLADETVLNLTNSEIWSSGFSGEDAIGSDNTFDALGSAFIQSFDLVINNIDEVYSQYTFEGAKVVITVGMELPYNGSTRIEQHKLGTYVVDSTSYNGATIHLYLLDYMSKFDREYTSQLTYPASLAQILRDACQKCDVILNTQNFDNSSIVIDTRPENTTYREVVSWIATIAGCFARCNENGALELKWFDVASLNSTMNSLLDGGTFNPWSGGTTYDGGTFNPWSSGSVYDGGTFDTRESVHYISSLFSQNISVDDTVITGVKIEVENDKGEKITYPQDEEQTGYLLSISGNSFITETNVSTVLPSLQSKLIGLTFRKLTVTQITDFSIEAGDVAVVIDRKGNLYRTLITRVTFSVSDNQTVVSGAETPLRNSAKSLLQSVKLLATAQKMVDSEKTIREQLYDDLSDRLDKKAGLYLYSEVTDTGTIYYLMDQPDLADASVVWKMTKDAFGVSTDGGQTWNAGLTVDGNLIANILAAYGISFDWARGGAISISKNGTETFYADVDTGTVRINADSISIGGSSVSDIAESVAKNSTNLLLSPDDLTNWNYWRSNGQGVGADSNGVIPGQTDPNGGTNAFKVTKGSDGTNTVLRVTPANNPLKSAGQNYSFSIWMKASATGSVNIYFNGTSAESTKSVSLTTSWKRYTFEIYASSITSLADYYLCIGGGGSWSPNIIYFYAPVVEYADPYMSQEQTFNQLTNNGADQCIKLQNGQLYINASYINTGYLSANRISGGTLSLGGANNTNGSTKVYNASGTQIGKWDKDGIEILDGIIKTKVLQTVPYEPGRYTQIKNGIFEIGYTDYNGTETLAGQFRSDRQNAVDSQGNSVIYYCLKILASAGKHLLLSCGSSLNQIVELKPVGDYSIIGTSNSINDFCVVGGNTTIRGRLAVDGRFTVDCPASSSADIVLSTREQETNTAYTFSILPNQSYYKFLFSHMVKMEKDLWVHGNLQVDGSYPSSSDERLKDIGIWSVPNDFLSEVEPIQFKWNDDRDDNKVHYGFGAQSVKELLGKYGMEDSAIVYYDEHQDKYYINYLEFIPMLTDKVQRLEEENKKLKKQLNDIERRLQRLEDLMHESTII